MMTADDFRALGPMWTACTSLCISVLASITGSHDFALLACAVAFVAIGLLISACLDARLVRTVSAFNDLRFYRGSMSIIVLTQAAAVLADTAGLASGYAGYVVLFIVAAICLYAGATTSPKGAKP